MAKPEQEKDHKILLKIVVQGTGIELEVNTHQPLHSVTGKALEVAGVKGGVDNWYFADESGAELDGGKTIAELGLTPDKLILLNQRAGAAGC